MTSRCVVALVAAALVVPAAWGDDAAEDLKKLQGTWHVTKGVAGGREVAREVADDSRFVVDGEIMTYESSRDKGSAKIKLEAGKKPRQLDVEVLDGAEKGKKRLGIYELAGDTLKLSMTRGEKRPESFDAKPQDDVLYFELKRAAR